MKILYPVLLFSALACSAPQNQQEDFLPMKVAKAYGLDQFDQVQSLEYTWNVQVDSNTVLSRSWKWVPESEEVDYKGTDTTLSYVHPVQDSLLQEIDARFINDKYWLMFPFQLAWDSGYDWDSTEDQTAPISGDPCTKLTIMYNQEDGYTPGDAYDLFLDEDHRIIEWIFRRGNGDSGRPMTWQNLRDFDGMQLTMDHRNDQGDLVLWFSDVKVNKK